MRRSEEPFVTGVKVKMRSSEEPSVDGATPETKLSGGGPKREKKGKGTGETTRDRVPSCSVNIKQCYLSPGFRAKGTPRELDWTEDEESYIRERADTVYGKLCHKWVREGSCHNYPHKYGSKHNCKFEHPEKKKGKPPDRHIRTHEYADSFIKAANILQLTEEEANKIALFHSAKQLDSYYSDGVFIAKTIRANRRHYSELIALLPFVIHNEITFKNTEKPWKYLCIGDITGSSQCSFIIGEGRTADGVQIRNKTCLRGTCCSYTHDSDHNVHNYVKGYYKEYAQMLYEKGKSGGFGKTRPFTIDGMYWGRHMETYNDILEKKKRDKFSTPSRQERLG